MYEEEKLFITLQCRDCELDKCIYCPLGKFVVGKQGCTRQVTEDTYAKFIHFQEEVVPFWKTYSPQQAQASYNEYIDFLFSEIYTAPIGRLLDKNAKAVKRAM